MDGTRGTPVLFVHGLWMVGLDNWLLRSRLAAAGFAPDAFRYPSTRASMDEVADALAARMRAAGERVHLIGHSLGGLVILETLERHAALPPGRVALLGSPVQGSRAARALAGRMLGPQLLGPLALAALTAQRRRAWQGEREIGVVAGTTSAGLGRLFADFAGPNDGTVAVDETELPGAADMLRLPVSHVGMLLSSSVADAVARFLSGGRLGAG